MTVVFDIVAKVRPDDFARIPLVDLSLLGSDVAFLVAVDNCSMFVLIVTVVSSFPFESVTGLVMEPVIGPATGSGIRLVMKPGILILFSLTRSVMTLVNGPVMTPETKPVIGP